MNELTFGELRDTGLDQKQNEEIEASDVVWHTFGTTHNSRAEVRYYNKFKQSSMSLC